VVVDDSVEMVLTQLGATAGATESWAPICRCQSAERIDLTSRSDRVGAGRFVDRP
jgi:hypothetical protein